MKQSILNLEYFNTLNSPVYRTVFSTQHGRKIYFRLEITDSLYRITDCFYIDREQGIAGTEHCRSVPLKLQTLTFPPDKLLEVIEAELDKKFYGVNFVQNETANLSLDEYIRTKHAAAESKYHFLVMIGEGETYNGLPTRLRTRLKNRYHRAVYVELAYYKDGQGVVNQCYYYDRPYRRQNARIAPPRLVSCFFPYDRESVLNLVNREICCNFTHIIVTSGIDIDSDTTPLCGAV